MIFKRDPFLQFSFENWSCCVLHLKRLSFEVMLRVYCKFPSISTEKTGVNSNTLHLCPKLTSFYYFSNVFEVFCPYVQCFEVIYYFFLLYCSLLGSKSVTTCVTQDRSMSRIFNIYLQKKNLIFGSVNLLDLNSRFCLTNQYHLFQKIYQIQAGYCMLMLTFN